VIRSVFVSFHATFDQFSDTVLSRCLCGVLNGNVGVMKSMIADLTDETNIAQGLALMPMTWAVGATIG